MTIVPVGLATGEIVLLLNHDEARELTDRIRQSLADLRDLIVEAWRRGAWTALGYESWQHYCAAELSEVAVPKEDRSTVIRALRSVGMTTRAIGSATGVDQATVVRDLQRDANASPATVTGLDGKPYPSTRTPALAASTYDPADPATAYAECEILVGAVIEQARIAIRAELALHLLNKQQIESLVDAVRKWSTDLITHLERGCNDAD